jgi:hypothetical protein
MNRIFKEALHDFLPSIRNKNSANLIILDQFGVSEVTPEVVESLSQCSATDIIFFISSSYIRRFHETPEIRSKFDISSNDMKNLDYSSIHRFICSYFNEKIENDEYYLVPFSIKKGSNIYGIIFGSGNLLGLEKFLKVCWELDKSTGEANFNIDGDFAWNGSPSLFEEFNEVNKISFFGNELKEFITANSPDNRALYKFLLVKGFLAKHVREILKPIREDGLLKVASLDSSISTPVRSNAYYLSNKDYKQSPKVKFTIQETK